MTTKPESSGNDNPSELDERRKSNAIGEGKKEELPVIHELSNQLVQQWLKIVKDGIQSELAFQRTPAPTVIILSKVERVSEEEVPAEETLARNDKSHSLTGPQTFYKLTLEDGTHFIYKVEANGTNNQVLENVEGIEMTEEEEFKDKDKKKDKKKSLG
ncbi:hypothetical protein FQA39_LY01132 [Lamprigera yunnana]|nr:hypothetical protein FQA39_LY01132 [Lamprigera yunnana]